MSSLGMLGNSPKPQWLSQASLTPKHSYGPERVTVLVSAEVLEGMPEGVSHPEAAYDCSVHCNMQNHTEV